MVVAAVLRAPTVTKVIWAILLVWLAWSTPARSGNSCASKAPVQKQAQISQALYYGQMTYTSDCTPRPLSETFSTVEELESDLRRQGKLEFYTIRAVFDHGNAELLTRRTEKLERMIEFVRTQGEPEMFDRVPSYERAIRWRSTYPCFTPQMVGGTTVGSRDPCEFPIEDWMLEESSRIEPGWVQLGGGELAFPAARAEHGGTGSSPTGISASGSDARDSGASGALTPDRKLEPAKASPAAETGDTLFGSWGQLAWLLLAITVALLGVGFVYALTRITRKGD